jgi:hypothetical protein
VELNFPRRGTPLTRSSRVVGVGLIAAGILALVLLVGGCHGLRKEDAGHVGVVRNGGPFDNNRIRQIIQPGSNLTWTGWWSQRTHAYPAHSVQRYYTITSDSRRGDRPGVDVVRVPTADGVQVGLEGTFYLRFVAEQDQRLLRKFDNQFGTRTFPVSGRAERKYPWEGDDGWGALLDTVVRPVIDNDLRAQIGQFRCVQLVSSCGLVNNTPQSAAGLSATQGARAQTNIQQIQDSINRSLGEDIQSKLGEAYFTDIQFNLARVQLPSQVQEAIDNAQAAFAAVAQSQARVRQAKLDAEANRERQNGYKDCPACAQIDTLKAIPPTVTTFAPGGSFAVTK